MSLLFLMLAAALATILSGLAPALQATRGSLTDAFRGVQREVPAFATTDRHASSEAERAPARCHGASSAIRRPGDEGGNVPFLSSRVVKWWLPEGVIFIDALPKTSVRKFDKKSVAREIRAQRTEASA
jgi:acyl-CoA synthetase (AMP-forming)/AMP-acid ligase II